MVAIYFATLNRVLPEKPPESPASFFAIVRGIHGLRGIGFRRAEKDGGVQLSTRWLLSAL